MKKILIATGALAIVGGSAGAGYYFMSRPAEANVDQPKEEPYVDPVKDPRYVDIDPLVLPMVRDGRILHHMFIKLSFEVDGKEMATSVLSQKVRVHHAIYMALYGRPLLAPDGDTLDLDKVKAVARSETQKVIGKDVIQSVQIQQAVPGQN